MDTRKSKEAVKPDISCVICFLEAKQQSRRGTSRAFAYSYSRVRASTLRKEHIYRIKHAWEHVKELKVVG